MEKMAEIMDHRFEIIFTRTHLVHAFQHRCWTHRKWQHLSWAQSSAMGNCWRWATCTVKNVNGTQMRGRKKILFHTIALAAYFKLQLKQIELHWALILSTRRERKKLETLNLFHSFYCFGGKLQNLDWNM